MTWLKKNFSSLLGLAVGCLFLYLTFAASDPAALGKALMNVSPWGALALVGLSLLQYALRGVRWWYLLPRPLRTGEMWAVQRANILGYAVTFVASRLGEVVRLLVLHRDSGRDLAGLTGTVVLERLLLDFVAFIALLLFALFTFRQDLEAMVPGVEPFLMIFLAVTLLGLLLLFGLATAPHYFEKLARWLRLDHLPFIGPNLVKLIGKTAAGLEVLNHPGRYVVVLGLNLVVWSVSLATFGLGLALFDIHGSWRELVFVFTLATVGVLIPSPGGLGTYHYMVTLGAVQILEAPRAAAQASAAFSHGVLMLTVMLAAIPAFWCQAKLPADGQAENDQGI